MRLIDIDSIQRDISSDTNASEEYVKGFQDGISKLLEIVDSSPTVNILNVVTEYCKRRRLVILTSDMYNKLKGSRYGEYRWSYVNDKPKGSE